MMARSLNILSSDDDEGIRAFLFNLLTEQGHHVEFARSGDEVFKHLGRARYDLLILDVNTPGLNGYKVAEKITANIVNRPKILIFTARNIEEEEFQFVSCGADAIIRKGASCDSIVAAIGDLFSDPEQDAAGTPPVAVFTEKEPPMTNPGDISLTTRSRMEGDLQYCLRKITQVEDQMATKDMRYEEFIRDLLREKQRTEKNYLEFKRIEQDVQKLKSWGYVVAAAAGFSLLHAFFQTGR